MHFSTLPLLATIPLALAQYGNPPDSSSTSSSAAPATTTSSSSSSIHTITVGNNALAFSPNTLTAAVGDTLEFQFFPPFHSVVQGTFSSPCSPLSNSSFFSGQVTTSSGTNSNVFTVTVNDTNPIWFYCGVPTHCEAGMSGVVNAPSDGSQTLAQYQAAAANAKTTTPSQAQGGVLGPANAVKPSSSGGSSSASSTPSSTSKPSSGNHASENVKWIYVALICIFSVGMSSLMV